MPVYKSDKPTKDGRSWYFKAHYVDLHGNSKQYMSKNYLTKTAAKEAEREFMLQLGEQQSDIHTFNEAADELLAYQKDRMQPKGYDGFKHKVEYTKRLLGNIPISKLTVPQYTKFYNEIASYDYTVGYKNDILSTCKRIIKFANKRYGISSAVPDMFDNFKDLTKAPKNVSYYTLDQFNKLIAVTDDIRFKALFSMLFYNGLRAGEANALNWKDISFENKTVNINKTINSSATEKIIYPPKTQSSYRELPLSETMLALLRELKDCWSKYKHFNDEWFCFGGIRALPNNTMQKARMKYMTAAGLPVIRLHDLRHSCASFLINQLRIPITSVSKYLGHENPQITLSVYSHFYREQLDSIASDIDKISEKL